MTKPGRKKAKPENIPGEEDPKQDPLLCLKGRIGKFPHGFAVERWVSFMAFQPARDFMLSIGIPDLSGPDSYKVVGTLLIYSRQMFTAQQQTALFDWINEINRPMMLAWGVQSFTIRELFSNPDDVWRFHRMLVAWGYGIYQCPNADPLTKEILDILGHFDLEK